MADGFWGSDFVAAEGAAPDFFTRIVERVAAGDTVLPAGFLLARSGEVMAAAFGARDLRGGVGDFLAGAARDANVFGAAGFGAGFAAAF